VATPPLAALLAVRSRALRDPSGLRDRLDPRRASRTKDTFLIFAAHRAFVAAFRPGARIFTSCSNAMLRQNFRVPALRARRAARVVGVRMPSRTSPGTLPFSVFAWGIVVTRFGASVGASLLGSVEGLIPA